AYRVLIHDLIPLIDLSRGNKTFPLKTNSHRWANKCCRTYFACAEGVHHFHFASIKRKMAEHHEQHQYAYMFHNHLDRKSTRLNSSNVSISYAVLCLQKQKTDQNTA